jgi:hypothetical protein
VTEQVRTEPVELRYTVTADDLVDAIAAQRGGFRGWRAAWFVVPVLLGLAIGFGRAEVWDTPGHGLLIIAIFTLVVALVAVAVGLVVFRFTVRWVHRWQARLLLRGNPALAQPIRATLTEAGIHAENETGESRSAWSQYPLYVETDRSFVLLASKGLGAMAVVLPKRALPGDDVARLRALLDSKSRRRDP